MGSNLFFDAIMCNRIWLRQMPTSAPIWAGFPDFISASLLRSVCECRSWGRFYCSTFSSRPQNVPRTRDFFFFFCSRVTICSKAPLHPLCSLCENRWRHVAVFTVPDTPYKPEPNTTKNRLGNIARLLVTLAWNTMIIESHYTHFTLNRMQIQNHGHTHSCSLIETFPNRTQSTVVRNIGFGEQILNITQSFFSGGPEAASSTWKCQRSIVNYLKLLLQAFGFFTKTYTLNEMFHIFDCEIAFVICRWCSRYLGRGTSLYMRRSVGTCEFIYQFNLASLYRKVEMSIYGLE